MAKEKKDGIKVNYVLEREIAEALDAFCERTGRTKTRVVEMAIKDFLERHKNDEL